MNILPNTGWPNDYVIETKNKGADSKSCPEEGSREDRRGCLAWSKASSELQVSEPKQTAPSGSRGQICYQWGKAEGDSPQLNL